jgi:MYXO-CTERM domain-containing protein
MKVKTLSALAGIGTAMILSGQANAGYTGLSVVKTDVNGTPGGNISVYRVYANFSSANDQLFAWGWLVNQAGQVGIESRNSTDTGAGSNFRNYGGNGDLPPSAYGVGQNPNLAYDSFFSINANRTDQITAANGGPIVVSPGAPGLGTASPDSGINSLTVASTGGAYSIAPTLPNGTPAALSFAGFAGDGDPENRILLMQLTVSQGDNVRGTIFVTVNNALAGATQDIGGQTFNSVPAPGALALLGLAGLVGSRRRRA